MSAFVRDGDLKIAMPRYYKNKVFNEAQLEQLRCVANDVAQDEFFKLGDYLELKYGDSLDIHRYIDDLRKKEFSKLKSFDDGKKL